MSIELSADGTATSGGPGRDDRSTKASGTWRLEGEVLSIDAPFLGGTYQVESVTSDALVLRRR